MSHNNCLLLESYEPTNGNCRTVVYSLKKNRRLTTKTISLYHITELHSQDSNSKLLIRLGDTVTISVTGSSLCCSIIFLIFHVFKCVI